MILLLLNVVVYYILSGLSICCCSRYVNNFFLYEVHFEGKSRLTAIFG